MGSNRVEDFLAVKWFDGLLVGSNHLAHADRRMDSLLGQASGSLMDQPGLVGEDSAGRTPSQLIEIDSQSSVEDEINVNFNITRGFQALTPSGRLVVGIPNAQARFGTPVTTLSASLSTQGASQADYHVCAQQVQRDDLKIEKKESPEVAIDLGYPGLQLEVVESGEFRQRVASDFCDFAVLGSVSLADGEPVVDAEFVPPVVRLQSVASFDDGLLASIKTLINDLYRLSVDMVQTSNIALAQGQMGADLLGRRTDYIGLRSLLLGRMGMVHNIERISPARYLFEVVDPLAMWWREYYQQQFKAAADQSPVKQLYDLANALLEMTYFDLCAGSDRLLRSSRRFVEGLNRELGMVG
jgi:hypothetical protein